jgi:zinc/manganese transport system substrate-binding protein
LAAIVADIGGSDVRVEPLIPGNQNAHFFDGASTHIKTLASADLFIQTGVGLESGWAPSLIQRSRNKSIQPGTKGFLDASGVITPVDTPTDSTQPSGDIHPNGNPHYLTDPGNGKLVADLIAKKLTELAPLNAGFFEKNRKSFQSRLDMRIQEWTHKMAPLKGTAFVSYHKNWTYFAKRFELGSMGEIEPKPGIPPSAADVQALTSRMKSNGVKILLIDPWSDKTTAESIAKATRAKIIPMAVGPGAAPKTTDYLSTIDYNVNALLKTLK